MDNKPDFSAALNQLCVSRVSSFQSPSGTSYNNGYIEMVLAHFR